MSGPANGSLIDLSWKKTKEILFPFQFKRWLKILLIVWLAGQGAGGNFNLPNRPRPVPNQTQQIQTQTPPTASVSAPGQMQSSAITQTTALAPAAASQPTPEELARGLVQKMGPWLFVLIPLVIVLSLLFMWLSARFHFIFLDLVISRDSSIGESFRKYKQQGNSLFLWSLAFGLILTGGLFLFYLPAFLFKSGVLLFVIIPFSLLVLIGAALLAVVIFDFVTPVMYRDGLSLLPAWNKWTGIRPKISSILIYILLKIGLGVLAFLFTLLIMFAVGLLVLLGILLAALIGALLAGALPFLKPVWLVLGGIFLIVAVLALIILFGLTTLPIPVFFRVFSLVYLARLIPEYNLLNVPPSDTIV